MHNKVMATSNYTFKGKIGLPDKVNCFERRNKMIVKTPYTAILC